MNRPRTDQPEVPVDRPEPSTDEKHRAKRYEEMLVQLELLRTAIRDFPTGDFANTGPNPDEIMIERLLELCGHIRGWIAEWSAMP